MLKHAAVAFAAAFFAGAAAGQVPVRPDPADARAAAARPVYESAFKDYRRYADVEPARWRESNEEMGRLNGHMGHVQGSRTGSGTPPPAGKAPAKSGHGHGGHK